MSLPIREWLPGYRIEWLRGDAVAGLTLAAYVIPQSMAYASVGGFPPETGLYCYLLAGLAYAVFGSSRTLAVGTTSSIALLVSSALSGMTGGDPDRYVALAMLAALLVAALGVLAWIFRLGQIGYFVSETILVGFKAGAAFVIASTQLPKLFGIPAGGDHFFERVRHLAAHLGETNPASLATGLVALALLLVGARISRRLPTPLLVVAGSIAATGWLDLGARGVAVVGEIPGGLPALGLPAIRPGDVRPSSRSRSPASCSPTWRASRRRARSRFRAASGSIRTRSSSPSAPRTSRPGSGTAFRSRAACRSPR